ncbi:translation initiation factor IF-2-like [Apus apus]|uniref:translation initiation factor IF-2-like n=1 Tax=Apus apus TaxID=8895 RepID=UPI0021F8BA2C|nr:translation initiation factor IF-2-like [Apus apus]
MRTHLPCSAPVERPRAPGRSGRAPRSAAGPEPAAAGPVGGILRPGLPGAPRPRPAPPRGPYSPEHPRPHTGSSPANRPRETLCPETAARGRGREQGRPGEDLSGPPSPGQPMPAAPGGLRAPSPTASHPRPRGGAAPTTPARPVSPGAVHPPLCPPPLPAAPNPTGGAGLHPPPNSGVKVPLPPAVSAPGTGIAYSGKPEPRQEAGAKSLVPWVGGTGAGPQPSPELPKSGVAGLGRDSVPRGAPGHRRGLLRTMESGRRYRGPGTASLPAAVGLAPAGHRHRAPGTGTGAVPLPCRSKDGVGRPPPGPGGGRARPCAETFSRYSGRINRLPDVWPGSPLN